MPDSAREYWKVRDQLHVADGLIFVGERLVVPTAMKTIVLQAIHEGNMGIERCKQIGRSCVYWLTILKSKSRNVKSATNSFQSHFPL